MSGATFPESSETELDHWLLSADLVPFTFLETSLKAELKLLRVMLVAYLFMTGLRHKASGSKGTEVLPLNHGILGKISPFTITGMFLHSIIINRIKCSLMMAKCTCNEWVKPESYITN